MFIGDLAYLTFKIINFDVVIQIRVSNVRFCVCEGVCVCVCVCVFGEEGGAGVGGGLSSEHLSQWYRAVLQVSRSRD